MLTAPAFSSMAASADVDSASGGFAQDALAVAVGSVVDFGTSLHNSVNWAWGGDDISTYDALTSMGMNTMASGYLEHKGLINTISFVGGMFIPGMAGIKISRMARAGLKGTNLLSTQHNVQSMASMAKMVTEGKKATTAYRALQNRTMLSGLAQGAVDNAAAELAIVGAFNAHPFMEDYMDDFGSNFAVSLAFGTAVGAGIDAASTWYGIKRVVGGAEAVANQTVLNALPSRSQVTDGIVNFQEAQMTIQSMDNLINNPQTSELSRQIAIRTRATAVEDADRMLESAFKGKLASDFTSSDEMAEHVRNIFRDPMLLGAGEASYYRVMEQAPIKRGFVRKLQDSIVRKHTNPKTGEEVATVRAVYSPRDGIVVSAEDAPALAGAADLTNVREISIAAKSVSPFRVDDTGLDLLVDSPAVIETKYLAALKGYDEVKFFKRAAVHENDLPSIQGLYMRSVKEKAELATLNTQVEDLRQLLPTATGDDVAKYKSQIKAAEKEIAERQSYLDIEVNLVPDAHKLFNTKALTPAVQKATGIKPTHLQDLDSITKTTTPMFSWEGLSSETISALHTWQGGGGGERVIRKAVAEYRRGRGPAWIKEIMEHPERQRQIAAMKQHADPDGYIYLRRGQNTRPNGHNEVESYTTVPRVSRNFAQGTAHDYAYKIKADDIVGNLGYTNGFNEAEWLVMAPTREYAVDANKITRLVTNEADNTLASSLPTVKLRDIKSTADEATRTLVTDLAKRHEPPEAIARRANITTENVHALLGSHADPNVPIQYNYTEADKIAEYLSPTNRMIALSDNGNLTTYSKYVHMMQQNADQAKLDKWNAETTVSLLQTSKSTSVNEYLQELGLSLNNNRGRNEFFNMMDTLKSSIGRITDGLAGNRFLQSADMYSRMMDDAGFITNYIGERSSRVANKVKDSLIAPANNYLSAIARNESELLAHNVIVQAYRSSGNKIVLSRDFELLEVIGTKQTAQGIIEDLRPLSFQGREIIIPETMPNVRALFRQYEAIGEEIQRMRTTHANVVGARAPSDKGLWLPNFDPRTKFVGFIRTTTMDADGNANVVNKIVTGNTLEELNDKRNVLLKQSEHTGERVEFIWPKEKNLQQSVEYDRLKQDAARGKLRMADVGQAKKGYSAEDIPKATLEEARHLLHGYSASIDTHLMDIQGLLMSDVLHKLDTLRDFSARAADDQAMSGITKFLKTDVPAATVMKSTLLGSRDVLDNYVPAKALNDAFSNAVDTAITTVNKITSVVSAPTRKMKVAEKWEQVEKELELAGIPYPYKAFDAPYIEKHLATESASGDARRLVSVGNAFASTMALRFMELAHPLVNMLSMPILTQSAAGSSAKAVMGQQAANANGMGMFKIARHMGNGVRYMNNPPPAMTALYKRAEHNGIFDPIVSEATNVIKLTRLREKGAIAQAERLVEKIDGTLGGKLVAASDWSETLSRKTAFGTGVSIAMERYGLRAGIDDDKIFLFARDFVDRSIGNYAAHQRPVMFHGTLGAAVGLFQTYMVTFAQGIYRNLEMRDFSTIAKTMAWQGSIFGMSSLPGYNEMSKYIGEHYTNDHIDLTTGAYKNLSDPIANVLVYGLPSNIGALWGDSQIGPNLTTRGEVSPRTPTIPAAEMIWESAKAVSGVAGRMATAGDLNAANGMLEALSVQSISRPLARMSELVSEHSITTQGRTVSTPEEVWTPIGVASRIMGTRTTEEWRTRSALHLNTYYGTIDRENRQSAMQELRTRIRAGTLTEQSIVETFDKYLENGGTPQGFRGALNNALEFEQQSLDYRLLDDLKPDSAIMHMIDTM